MSAALAVGAPAVTATMAFSELLAAHAEQFYGLLGAQLSRDWQARRELRRAGVSETRIEILYPKSITRAHLSTRLVALARQNPELFNSCSAAAAVAQPIQQATLKQALTVTGIEWHKQNEESSLRRWLKSTDGEWNWVVGSSRLERLAWNLIWAFECPITFELGEQQWLIAGIDAVADRLNWCEQLRTAAYLQGPAQVLHSAPEANPQGDELQFVTCTRQERLADLWVWGMTG